MKATKEVFKRPVTSYFVMESFAGPHSGMIPLLLKDLAKTGIRFFGELSALILLFQTLCLLLAVAFKSSLSTHMDISQALSGLDDLVTGLIAAVSGLFQSVFGIVGMNADISSLIQLYSSVVPPSGGTFFILPISFSADRPAGFAGCRAKQHSRE